MLYLRLVRILRLRRNNNEFKAFTHLMTDTMKLFKKYLILIFLMFAAKFSFGQNKLEGKITPIPESNKILEIPKYENGHPYIYWHFCKQKEAQLNLSRPETSVDSVLIRIWVTIPTKMKDQRHDLFEVRYSNNEWVAQVINMRVDLKKSKLQELIRNHMVTKVKPTSDWESLIDSLFLWKIDSLPTDQQLNDYSLKSSNYGNNAPTFCFEYSTPVIYRFYQYNNVWAIQDSYWQAENVVKIINLIDREFQVDSLANDFYSKNLEE